MKNFFKYLFRKNKTVEFNIAADSIPVALGYPIENFDLLTNMLTNFLDTDNKVVSFAAFLENPAFKQFKLDLSDPNDSLVLGYAFCAAIILQRSMKTQEAVNNVLEAFSPPSPVTTPSKASN